MPVSQGEGKTLPTPTRTYSPKNLKGAGLNSPAIRATSESQTESVDGIRNQSGPKTQGQCAKMTSTVKMMVRTLTRILIAMTVKIRLF
jgi:hypothetical protein